ncbi:MAG: hypothetical protein UT33_C0005G0077 [Candidatus Peregrinibacteria bacterium GW2011_GWC2_39_14]|nr:MAG: hypothetical protein US92_C0001G0077 [Candidatus Peregrinibacteria bacterium GW2011_GWA2_38_36]KKR07133.1 MAG: hypothetical protein UT33_C0005G0077 [Candidatus Peregrinibacteria bacterium GW2011_GWC2_39_14]
MNEAINPHHVANDLIDRSKEFAGLLRDQADNDETLIGALCQVAARCGSLLEAVPAKVRPLNRQDFVTLLTSSAEGVLPEDRIAAAQNPDMAVAMTDVVDAGQGIAELYLSDMLLRLDAIWPEESAAA